jgi:hypothetical protein
LGLFLRLFAHEGSGFGDDFSLIVHVTPYLHTPVGFRVWGLIISFRRLVLQAYWHITHIGNGYIDIWAIFTHTFWVQGLGRIYIFTLINLQAYRYLAHRVRVHGYMNYIYTRHLGTGFGEQLYLLYVSFYRPILNRYYTITYYTKGTDIASKLKVRELQPFDKHLSFIGKIFTTLFWAIEKKNEARRRVKGF